MSNCSRSALLTVTFLLLMTGIVPAQESGQSDSRWAGYVSLAGGNFSLSWPQMELLGVSYGFEDVYGSKSGLSYGGEGGVGLGDIGLFFVLKARIWKKSGSPVEIGPIDFNGDAEWEQTFVSIGARYFLVEATKNNKAFLPFLGAGIVHSKAKETLKGQADYLGEQEYISISEEVDGTGFYLEGGADFFISPTASVRGVVDYSMVNLGASVGGARAEIDGGGGLYAGVSINLFFGRAMKNP